jgi:hypothetical protein
VFTATNVVTFVVYAALGGVFFLLVVTLQTVAGFSPIAAGTSLLPVTACMLLLSSSTGALAQRIGPRLPMTVGPMACAVGALLMLRIGRGASYGVDVLPAVLVFGLGLAMTVSPLTATVLGAAPARYAGVASGVNNAVARTAGLLAVAVLPLVAGLRGADYREPALLEHGFHVAMAVAAGLLAVGGLTSLVAIPTRTPCRPSRRQVHCAVDGPPQEPAPERASVVVGREA